MTTAVRFKRGQRVLVPWGLGEPRLATVVEVWGNPASPTHVRVKLVPRDADEDPSVLLLSPRVVTPAA
jgi:hypothetical protein